jgi:hypothetical protein
MGQTLFIDEVAERPARIALDRQVGDGDDVRQIQDATGPAGQAVRPAHRPADRGPKGLAASGRRSRPGFGEPRRPQARGFRRRTVEPRPWRPATDAPWARGRTASPGRVVFGQAMLQTLGALGGGLIGVIVRSGRILRDPLAGRTQRQGVDLGLAALGERVIEANILDQAIFAQDDPRGTNRIGGEDVDHFAQEGDLARLVDPVVDHVAGARGETRQIRAVQLLSPRQRHEGGLDDGLRRQFLRQGFGRGDQNAQARRLGRQGRAAPASGDP